MPKANVISHFVKDLIDDRSSHWKYSVRKVALRNFAKFIGKHLGQSLFYRTPLTDSVSKLDRLHVI